MHGTTKSEKSRSLQTYKWFRLADSGNCMSSLVFQCCFNSPQIGVHSFISRLGVGNGDGGGGGSSRCSETFHHACSFRTKSVLPTALYTGVRFQAYRFLPPPPPPRKVQLVDWGGGMATGEEIWCLLEPADELGRRYRACWCPWTAQSTSRHHISSPVHQLIRSPPQSINRSLTGLLPGPLHLLHDLLLHQHPQGMLLTLVHRGLGGEEGVERGARGSKPLVLHS